MDNVIIKDKDVITMKLLHFFITEEGYTPIIVHGVQDEIWLENMKGPYSIIRIMSGHIHNREQLEFDLYKTHSLITRIKRKTLSFRVKALSIFLDVEDNVELTDDNGIDCVNVNNEGDIKKHETIKDAFPNIASKLEYSEDGLNLFVKITDDINKTTEKEAKKNEEVFTHKKPYVTILLIAINVLAFIYTSIYGIETVGTYGGLYAPYVREGEFYRLITSVFLHANVFHLFLNMYALYIIGSQIESFFGSFKYLIIYLFSALTGSLLSMAFLGETWSIGASGAIFGLFGSMLYFGYNYRVYLGSTIKTQIVPLIVINLLIGFTIPGIDPFAHLGGLIGGIIISMAVGLKYKTSTMEKINGVIISILAMIFLIYVAFVYSVNI
jgi:rhomboid protease GluP